MSKYINRRKCEWTDKEQVHPELFHLSTKIYFAILKIYFVYCVLRSEVSLNIMSLIRTLRIRNNRILLFIFFTSLYFIINLMLLTSDLDFKYTKSILFIHYLANNLVQPPIMDLRIEALCDSGYEEIPIGEWPGIKQNATNESLPEENCQYDPVSKLKRVPRTLWSWRDLKICARYPEEYIFTLEECPSGFRKCQNDLCISEYEEKCPLTLIRVQYGKFENVASIMMEVARDRKEKPLISLEYSQTKTPCYASDAVPKSEKVHPQLNICFGCGLYGQDNNSIVIDSMKEYVFLGENRLFFEDLEDVAPGYLGYIANNTAYLLGRRRVSLRQSQECYQEAISMERWKTFHDFIHEDNYRSATMILILWEVILLGYSMFAMGFLYSSVNYRYKQPVVYVMNRVAFEFLSAMSLLNFCWIFFGRASNIRSLNHLLKYFENMLYNDCLIEFDILPAYEDLTSLRNNLQDNNIAQITLLWMNAGRMLAGHFILTWGIKHSLLRTIINDATGNLTTS